MKKIMLLPVLIFIALFVVLTGCERRAPGTFCCQLPDGSCISVKYGADGEKECAAKNGTQHLDKECRDKKCVDIPAERLGCCQISTDNCVTTTKEGCITGTWYSEFACIEGRCKKPEN
jgi:hypothetical protein